MSDELYEKTEALLKSLLSIKTKPGKNNSEVPAAIKGLTIPTPKLPSKLPDLTLKAPTMPKPTGAKLPKSAKQAEKENKIPGGLPPASKKDPQKVAEQLKNPNPTKPSNPQEDVLKADSNGQWYLEKAVLDPNAGYKFTHEHHDLGNGNTLTRVNVHGPDGEHVGAATFAHQGGNLVPGTVAVDEAHQRRGIASAMYAHAERQTGKKLIPSPNQTLEGAALWTGNKTKTQFG